VILQQQRRLPALLSVLLESLEERYPSKTSVGIRFSSEAELPGEWFVGRVDRIVWSHFTATHLQATFGHQIQGVRVP
jgi:hypothetical protein